MPDGLDIDTKQPLNGTMAPYAEQILVCTGKDDWTSRIEDDEASGMARGLKELLGRGGKFSDPYHNVLITNASFAPTTTTNTTTAAAAAAASSRTTNPLGDSKQAVEAGSAFLFPSFRFFPSIPLNKPGLESFVKSHVLPTTLHPAHDVLSPTQRAALLRATAPPQPPLRSRRVAEAVVLICGHGGRDARCGAMGPLLRDEFREKLAAAGYEAPESDEHDMGESDDVQTSARAERRARVGLISHIGGHKYAGNVILYVPPGAGAAGNPLAGCGVWYGRVRPEHVEGIVAETLGKGRIVKDLFRGGIGADGRPMML